MSVVAQYLAIMDCFLLFQLFLFLFHTIQAHLILKYWKFTLYLRKYFHLIFITECFIYHIPEMNMFFRSY